MTAKASDDKMSSVFSLIRSFFIFQQDSLEGLGKIAGRIASLRPALGYFVHLTLRSAYASIACHVNHFGWSGFTSFSPETKRELEHFLDYAVPLNGYPLLQDYCQQLIQSLLSYSESFAGDASAVGACAFSIQSPSRHFFQTRFSEEEMSLSTGHRELLTLKKAVLSGLVPASTSIIWLSLIHI